MNVVVLDKEPLRRTGVIKGPQGRVDLQVVTLDNLDVQDHFVSDLVDRIRNRLNLQYVDFSLPETLQLELSWFLLKFKGPES